MIIKYFLSEILKGKSIGRALLFCELKNLFQKEKWLNNKYSVLEMGSESASHQRTFPKEWIIKKSNYVQIPDLYLDYIFSVEEKFSIPDKKFDGIVFFNLLYLVDNYMNCLSESLRISAKFILFNIPLISGVAKHPTDFNRFTEDRLISIFKELKKKRKILEFKIIKFGGSFSSAVNLIDCYLKFRIIKIPIYLIVLLLDKLDKLIKRDCPMQYLVLIKNYE